jgi:hypothetical protein
MAVNASTVEDEKHDENCNHGPDDGVAYDPDKVKKGLQRIINDMKVNKEYEEG